MFNEILVRPILNLLLVFYKLFNILAIPGAFGWSIILLTITIRFLLNPLTQIQMRSMKKLAQLKPQLDELTRRHGADRQRLQQEQLKLYQQAGVNPAAGCLPALVQIPVFIALYNVFFQILGKANLEGVITNINKEIYPFFSFLKVQALNLSFFGVDLAIKPSDWQKMGIWLLIIPVITGFLQWVQTKISLPPQPTVKSSDKNDEDDFSKAMQTQTGVILPIMIGFFAYSFPLGLSLYWNTFTVFGIIQQLKINKTENLLSFFKK